LVELIRNKKLANCLLEVQAWAAKGDSFACLTLAHAYYNGGHGVDINFKEAKRWLERIDKSQDLNGYSEYLLGVIHVKGLADVQDNRKAYVHFRRATLRGSVKSRIAIAAMQRQGIGTLKKPRSAKIHFYRCSKASDLPVLQRWFFRIVSCLT
jgi:TPR repeat protein